LSRSWSLCSSTSSLRKIAFDARCSHRRAVSSVRQARHRATASHRTSAHLAVVLLRRLEALHRKRQVVPNRRDRPQVVLAPRVRKCDLKRAHLCVPARGRHLPPHAAVEAELEYVERRRQNVRVEVFANHLGKLEAIILVCLLVDGVERVGHPGMAGSIAEVSRHAAWVGWSCVHCDEEVHQDDHAHDEEDKVERFTKIAQRRRAHSVCHERRVAAALLSEQTTQLEEPVRYHSSQGSSDIIYLLKEEKALCESHRSVWALGWSVLGRFVGQPVCKG